ncbi:hypothetical protein EDM80_03870 [bacterium]|nr:MAG: hypothetical protein EDM80_03870 [bacterium]
MAESLTMFGGKREAAPEAEATWLAAPLLLLALLAILLWLRQRQPRGRIAVADEDIFKKQCEANQLTPHQEFLLREMYFDLKLSNPVLPFTCPQVHAEYRKSVSGRRLEVLDSVTTRLFG